MFCSCCCFYTRCALPFWLLLYVCSCSHRLYACLLCLSLFMFRHVCVLCFALRICGFWLLSVLVVYLYTYVLLYICLSFTNLFVFVYLYVCILLSLKKLMLFIFVGYPCVYCSILLTVIVLIRCRVCLSSFALWACFA